MEQEAHHASDARELRHQAVLAAEGPASGTLPMVASVLAPTVSSHRATLGDRKAVRRGLSRVVNPHYLWPRVFRAGLLMWAAAVVVTQLTGDLTLVPTVILLGSFLVPVTCLIAAWEHRYSGSAAHVSTTLVARAATVGGLEGLLAAAGIEQVIVHQNLAMYYEVGLIEEAAKLAALLWCARRLSGRTMRDGLVLGASVGFGFAALESAGYAFNALFTPQGLSLSSLVDTEVLRAGLAPFGHGVWTAVAAAAWFAAFPSGWAAVRRSRKEASLPRPALSQTESRTPSCRRFARLIAVVAFFLVAMLHAAFDGMHGIVLTVLNLPRALRTGSLPQLRSALADGTLEAPAGTVSYHVAYDIGLTLVILLGLSGLLVARQAIRRHEAATTSPEPPASDVLVADGTRPLKER